MQVALDEFESDTESVAAYEAYMTSTGRAATLPAQDASLRPAQSSGPSSVTNVYTGGLSLASSLPSLGRVVATVVVGLVSIVLSGFPALIEEAQSWITHLGNVAAPLTGVVLADYLVRQRGRLDVEALFDTSGRYRYLRGVNVEAVLAVAVAVGVYYAVPDAWVKVAWGLGAGGATYLALAGVFRPRMFRTVKEPV